MRYRPRKPYRAGVCLPDRLDLFGVLRGQIVERPQVRALRGQQAPGSEQYALQQCGALLRVLAQHEKTRLHIGRAQDAEDLRRPPRIGPVVKGNRDLMRRAGAAVVERREGWEIDIFRA